MDLKKMKVQDLNKKEMKKIDGGWWQEALAVAGAVIYLYNEGGDFIKGFKEGYNSTRYKQIQMKELTTLEMKSINGGDKFLKDLGTAVGKAWGSFVKAVEDFAISLGEYRGNY